ncbi:MAG TPA: hypothetical protein VIZ28_06750, partial [Chitinophagaceae bacterium]
MTNNEILQANLLDIVFDNRNKEYGAYALRRDYNKTMLLSLGAGLSVLLFFILFNIAGQDNGPDPVDPFKKLEDIVTVEMLPADHKKPELPKEQPKPAQSKKEKVATVEFTTPRIVPNDQVEKPVTAQSELDGKQIANETTAGSEVNDQVIVSGPPVDNSGTGSGPAGTEPGFAPSYSDPEY